MGLSETATENLIGDLLRIPPRRRAASPRAPSTRLLTAISLAKSLGGALGAAAAIGIQIRAQAHAAGGVFSTPHVGLVAEAGPEAIIPLDNPARAQQVMAEAGLTGMTSPNINIYIGNDQIDNYIDDRVDRRMVFTARSLAYGGREI